MTSARVTVTSAPTLLIDQGGKVENVRVQMRNLDATNGVDLGGSGVATGQGYPLKAGETDIFTLGRGDKLYAVSAGPTVSVAVIRFDTED